MSGTAAGKGHFTTTWPGKVLKGDLSPAFMVDLALKDLRIAVDVARETGAPLNMGIAAESYYAAASQDGKGRQDWSALLNQAARISNSALLDYLLKTKLFIRQNGRSIRRKDSGRGNFKIGEYTVGDGFWLPCCRKHQAHGLTLIDS